MEVTAEVVTSEKKGRTQAVSISYTLEAFKKNIEKLNEAGLIVTENYEELKRIQKEVVGKYVANKYGLE